MTENEVCPYLHKRMCTAQGELKVMCGTEYKYKRRILDENEQEKWLDTVCRYAENPTFDRVTELQNDMIFVFQALQSLLLLQPAGEVVINQINKRIKSLKEKMRWVREE